MSQPAAWTRPNFRWSFTPGEPTVFQLEGVPPVYFDGERARTRNWLATKHADGAMHEPNFSFVLARLFEVLDPDVYFDVGGYIGYFTVLPLAWTRPSTRIVTFEMNPGWAKQIFLNVQQNRHLATSRSLVINAGITNEVRLASESTFEGFKLRDDNNERSTDSKAESAVIDLLTLDYVCETMELRPNLIKMDIEGHEAPALAGAHHMLSQVRPTILFELHADSLLGRHGATRASVLEVLESHDYALFEVPGNRWSDFSDAPPLTKIDGANRDKVVAASNTGLVAIPNEQRSRIDSLVS